MATKKPKNKSKNQLKISEIKAMNVGDLKTQSLDLHKEQFNLLMQLKTNQLKNTADIRRVKKSIAKVKTVINQKMNEK